MSTFNCFLGAASIQDAISDLPELIGIYNKAQNMDFDVEKRDERCGADIFPPIGLSLEIFDGEIVSSPAFQVTLL